MPPGMTAVDMAVSAARSALVAARVEPGDVDFVFGSSFVPDIQNSPDACGVHRALSLRPDCFTLTVDAVCNSFQAQLALAEGLLARGHFKQGLLVQSAASSRVVRLDSPMSVHFGDGATAVLVGSGNRRRLLGQEFETESELYRALALTVPGGDWWEDGHVWSMPLDKVAARRMMPVAPAAARRVVSKLLRDADVSADDVGFFACHQATVWFRELIQEFVGLGHAKSYDSYKEAGSISAANLPLVLERAESAGLLSPGDLVVTFQGGTGATYGASLIRW